VALVGQTGEVRIVTRFVPTIVVVDKATSVIDLGLAVTANILGAMLGVLTAVVVLLWRITTPTSAPPLSVSVRPVGQRHHDQDSG
jgi:hypothetical protein